MDPKHLIELVARIVVNTVTQSGFSRGSVQRDTRHLCAFSRRLELASILVHDRISVIVKHLLLNAQRWGFEAADAENVKSCCCDSAVDQEGSKSGPVRTAQRMRNTRGSKVFA